jgi:hypothetical protein
VPLPVFEAACVAVLILALAAMARRRPAGELLLEYAALAIAGFVGEETCVALYDHYHYAAGWHLRLDRVPLLVPLIWPLVILSARDVAASVWPARARIRPLLVGAIVAFDASLVEVIAARAGLWSWSEPGHLGVPLIGILGWGYFAAGADLALSGRLPLLGGAAWRRARDGGPLADPESRTWTRALGALVFAPLAAHALILASWWALFRWTLRGALGAASLAGLAALGALALALVIAARRRGGAIPLSVALPRMVAAGLFFALLLATAPADGPLWLHTAVVAIPYFAATELAPGSLARGAV